MLWVIQRITAAFVGGHSRIGLHTEVMECFCLYSRTGDLNALNVGYGTAIRVSQKAVKNCDVSAVLKGFR